MTFPAVVTPDMRRTTRQVINTWLEARAALANSQRMLASLRVDAPPDSCPEIVAWNRRLLRKAEANVIDAFDRAYWAQEQVCGMIGLSARFLGSLR